MLQNKSGCLRTKFYKVIDFFGNLEVSKKISGLSVVCPSGSRLRAFSGA